MPLPRSAKPTVEAKTSVRARVSRLAITRLAAGLIAPDFLNASHHNAVTPATCGQAMLVPLRLRKPPPTLAERMSTPGAAICGRVLEKGAIANLPAASRPIAPTETTLSAAAGLEAGDGFRRRCMLHDSERNADTRRISARGLHPHGCP